MRRRLLSPALLGIAVAAAGAAMLVPAGYAAEQVKGYDNFKLVRTRNIFDPNRQPPRGAPPPQTTRVQPAAPPAPKQLVLYGTMVTANKTVAFFGGTLSEYRKVVPAGETIAGFKIASIQQSQVELERDGKRVVLPLGQMIAPDAASPSPTTAPDEAPPAGMASRERSPGPAAPGSAPAAPGAPATSAPGAPAERNEILRRMMERRQRETSR